MKNIIRLIIFTCIFAACQDSSKSSTEQKQTLREVGALITKQEAERWTSRFKSSAMRQQSSATISKTTLQQAVNSLPGYDGVYFHHALEKEKHHILVVPYKEGQSLWTSALVVDANSDAQAEVATANLWAERYMAENPEGPWSHFFGRHVFETILSNEEFDEMEIVPAINDAGLPQLLLYVWYGSLSANARTKAEVDVYDRSNQCPPYCPADIN